MTTELTPEAVRGLREQADEAATQAQMAAFAADWQRQMKRTFRGILTNAERVRFLEHADA